MRLLQQFFEALEKLVEERDKKDGPELQLQLQSIYRAYFNHPSTFYYDQDAEYILNEMGQNYGGEELLTRIDMLSELLYQDALLKESEEQKYLLRKSLFLLNYLDTHSDTFSFERRYNPQNEMFRRFRTKCSISQNETYPRESFFPPL